MKDSNPASQTTPTEADKWYAIKFMARHIFLCWPRRWQYEWAAPNKDRRTCLRCGLIHEYEV
jgi:hypothetical protein